MRGSRSGGEDSEFSGKTVLVTGASRGIGREIALDLYEKGASVIAHCNREMGALRDAFSDADPGRVHFIAGDLSTVSGMKSVAEGADKITGRLSGLVNNAGVYSGLSLEEETVENWDRVINTNLRSPFFLTKLLRKNLEAAGGSVVNISSVMGVAPSAGAYAYQASKSALIHITKALSIDLAPKVRVNCVAPGFTMTDMNRDGWKDDSFRAQVEDSTPLGRWGKPEDISGIVCFLLSDRASFITGQSVGADGGKNLV